MQKFFLTKPLKLYFIKIIGKKSVKYINDNYWAWKNHILDMKNQFEVNDVDEICQTFSDLIDKKRLNIFINF